jgi:hypothetical protein
MSFSSASEVLTLFPIRGFFYPEDGGEMFLRNVGFYKDPHGATSQKATFFIVTAVKPPNPVYILDSSSLIGTLD